MRSLLVTFLLFAGCLFPCYSQSTQVDSLYLVTYMTGPAWDTTKKPNEQAYFKEHSASLSKLYKEGVLKLGARYADKGIIVIAAPSAKVATEIIFKDEAIIHKLFTANIQGLHVFYGGCVERPK